MSIHFSVLGKFNGKILEKDYFVTSTETARRTAYQDGASAVYRIKQGSNNWLAQQFYGREYGMQLLRAINFQVDAGVPVAQAMQTAIESETDINKRSRLQGAIDSIARGASLADSLFATGLYDSTVYSILASGERIGGVGAIKSAMEYLDDRKAIWKSYWIVLSWIAMEFSTALSVPPMISDFAIPYIRDHLPKSSPAEIAIYTEQLDTIAFNNMCWMWLSSALVAIAAIMTFLWFTNPRFKDWLAHNFLIHIPMLGDWYTNDALSRSSKVFSSMLNAGVRMPDAIRTILRSTKNSVAKQFWAQSYNALNTGSLPGAAFASTGILRKDEILVLNAAKGSEQFARAFAAMSEERAWRQKALGTRIFRMSLVLMMVYIGITLLIGFQLFGLFNAGLDMTMNSMMKGV